MKFLDRLLAKWFQWKYDLPEQQQAWLMDQDGTKHYHDLDLHHNGEPHGEVRIGLYVKDGGPPAYKSYKFSHTFEGYLIYKEEIDWTESQIDEFMPH